MKKLALEDPRWVDFVAQQRTATLFHHPAWARLLADAYGYRAHVLALVDGDSVVAGLPVIDLSRPLGRRRWASLPFTDHCPPLDGGRGGELADALGELARSRVVDVLEVRASFSPPARHDDAAFVRHAVPLGSDPQLTWQGLAKNHRRNVRIAEKAGVRIVRGGGASDIDVFYALHLRTRRRLGVPVQPRRFFRLVLERVIQPGLGFVLTAYTGDVPIAAAIFGSWNGTLLYKYSARDERYAKLDANYLLLWTAIQWASDSGHHTFDLGRSDVGQVQLREFKDGWGAREEALSYSWIARAPWKPTPHRAQGAMGVVIRNSAPWVCRAIGEMLYRYAT